MLSDPERERRLREEFELHIELLVAILASLVPAARASRVNPVIALRGD